MSKDLAREFYDKSIESAKGEPGKATAYGSKKSRLMRYRCANMLPALDADKWDGRTVLDVGCGPGQFYSWLKKAQAAQPEYSGIDPTPGMIELAKKRKVPNVACEDVFESSTKHDWVVANCIFASAFTEKWKDNLEIVAGILKQMHARSNLGMCFDVVKGEKDCVLKEVQPGYHELRFTPEKLMWVCQGLGTRFLIDASTSTHFMTAYVYNRPQIYERLTEAELE